MPFRNPLARLHRSVRPEAEPSAVRRALMIGGVVSVVAMPLPALASTAPAVAECPELLAYAAAFREHLSAFKAADAARVAARKVYDAIRPERPPELLHQWPDDAGICSSKLRDAEGGGSRRDRQLLARHRHRHRVPPA